MKRNRKKEDFYSSLMLYQLVLGTICLILFALLSKGSGGEVLKKDFTSLLGDDFLSRKMTSVVSSVKDYFSKDNTFAVFSDNTVYITDGNISKKANDDESTTYKSPLSEENSADTLPLSVPVMLITDKSLGIKYGDDKALEESINPKKSGKLLFPVEGGCYTSYFGSRSDPFDGSDDYHGGVDIAADYGEKIRAAHNGTVTCVGEDAVSGKYIFITYNDNFETFYCHCSEILAQEGAVIRQGEAIALVGSTGASTGPHVHFEVRVDGEKTDPLPYLNNAL